MNVVIQRDLLQLFHMSPHMTTVFDFIHTSKNVFLIGSHILDIGTQNQVEVGTMYQ